MARNPIFSATLQAALLGATSNILAQLIEAYRKQAGILPPRFSSAGNADEPDRHRGRLDPRLPVPHVQHHQHAAQFSMVSRPLSS